ncbi:MAG: N-6 DNA methylase [Candidatus Cloacimonadaceae bacterium]|nr:N-6 DNA methylase [Candidatus Cloacimonadaceae bacterium]
MIDSKGKTSIIHSAKLLGVSVATVRNWIKTGVIGTQNNDLISIDTCELNSLMAKIERGETQRLNKRANKLNSNKMIIPNEYSDQASIQTMLVVVKICKENDLNLSSSMWYSAVLYLWVLGEIFIDEHFNIDYTKVLYRRNSVKTLIETWKGELHLEIDNSIFEAILSAIILAKDSTQSDFLGALYQLLANEGSKSEKGSYYTPVSIVDNVIPNLYKQGMTFLDPCCGTGQFLLSCAKQIGCKVGDLYGIDSDLISVKIASINLLLAFPEDEFTPNIYHYNTLTDVDFNSLFNNLGFLQNMFDLIATNPPWGSVVNKTELIRLYPMIKSGESFAYFIVKCYEFIKPEGKLSFILPESILNVNVHKDIRQFIIEHYLIQSITELGRAFAGVYTKVCRIDLVRTTPSNENIITIFGENSTHYQRQSQYAYNSDFAFTIFQRDDISKLLKKIFDREYITFKGNADWALGIVTGNNEKYLSDNLIEGYEAIFRGRDVFPLKLGLPQKHILFKPEQFQQVAPEWKFRVKEKIIYRFISNQLVCAYDDKQVLTLNSANILIPRNIGIDIKTITTLLNSEFYNFLFSALFNTHKILKSNLEELPLPMEFLDEGCDVHKIALAIMNMEKPLDIIDDYLCKFYQLNESEIELIHEKRR